MRAISIVSSVVAQYLMSKYFEYEDKPNSPIDLYKIANDYYWTKGELLFKKLGVELVIYTTWSLC